MLPFIARPTTFALLAGAALLTASPTVSAEIDWNDHGIRWMPYQSGIEEAAAENKPVCLILFAEWCPHCHHYGAVFKDSRIVREAKRFVMIRIDVDKQPDIAQYYTPDGGYVPRTIFIAPSGAMRSDVHVPRARYQFFYDESDPQSLLKGMEKALEPRVTAGH